MHVILTAGDAEGGMNFNNVFKPALSRGELQMIGCTTTKEYQRYIQKDKALERRFKAVVVDEPSTAETLEILKKIKPTYEEIHKVKYSDKALEACVNLSVNYMKDKNLPDKAIEIMDDVGAKVKILGNYTPEITDLKKQYEEIETLKLEVIKNKRYGIAEDLIKKSKRIDKKIKRQQKVINKNTGKLITVRDVEEVVEEMTNIPISNNTFDLEKINNIFNQNIVGQDHATKEVYETIMLNQYLGIKENKPIASFLFIGNSGMGKTELAKQLANSLGGKDFFIRIDCSEYQEKFNISKLIGSPAGYIGHEEGGLLTNKVKNKPFCVILLDEVEKAHPDLFNLLLQVLDDGHLTDGKGETVYFNNTIIILTSNLGTSNIAVAGFKNEGYRDDSSNAVKKFFRPELLNRLDNIIKFNILTPQNLLEILKRDLKSTFKKGRLKNLNIKIEDDYLIEKIEQNYNPLMGYRHIDRTVKKKILLDIANNIKQKNKNIKFSLNLKG